MIGKKTVSESGNSWVEVHISYQGTRKIELQWQMEQDCQLRVARFPSLTRKANGCGNCSGQAEFCPYKPHANAWLRNLLIPIWGKQTKEEPWAYGLSVYPVSKFQVQGKILFPKYGKDWLRKHPISGPCLHIHVQTRACTHPYIPKTWLW